MAEPITTALIVGLAAQKFAEGAAGKSAEKLVEKLWDAIVTRFSGRKKTEENLAAIEKAKGADAGAIEKVSRVLDGEFVEDEAFEKDLKDLAQQIVNIQNQNQTATMMSFVSNDQSQMRAVGVVHGTANLGDGK
jgi:predicted RNA binding protein with dsRBD fold (UPF0201 family)